MALIDLGTADGSTIGNPTIGNYFLFLDSTNSDYLTRRDSSGVDTLYTSGVIPDGLDNRIIVNQANIATTLGGVIDSTKEYFIDGILVLGSISIEVPAGGINIKGYDFNISKLYSNVVGHEMFTSPVGGSGDVLFTDFSIENTGVGSKVHNLVSATGFNAYEIARINFDSCKSRGEINNYRQGLETGTGYFSGTPELTLSGAWAGGYFIDVSIARNLTDGAYPLFKAGVGFTMASRFRSNQNLDLNTNIQF